MSADASLLNLDRIRAEQQYRARRKIDKYYPDEGPLRRELYPRHLQFFAGGGEHEPMPDCCPAGCTGKPHRERACVSANRVGKTEGLGAYEVTLHATGQYPSWWKGRRFDKPIKAWAAGDTSRTVRDSVQPKLIGPINAIGTGMIPGDLITHRTLRQGVSDSIDTIYVKHISGGTSSIVLKSYDQRREGFQSSEVDVIWLDEEPDQALYVEALTRTMTTDGMLILTMTPLLGMSEVVLAYLEGNEGRPKFCSQITWDDIPHLTEEAKADLKRSIPAYQLDARSKGIPVLGSGAIFPISPEEYAIDGIEIPDHWPKAYGFDIGWRITAATFGALDRDTDCLYIYSEHYRGEAEPVIHAEALKARGAWIKGAIDPAARGRNQIDGRNLLDMYRQLGLDLVEADNSAEAGLYQVLMRFNAGRLKIFKSCQNLLGELRLYRRDERGRVVKERDHCCDSLRYLCMSLLEICRTKPAAAKKPVVYGAPPSSSSWMT